ncbi:peptidoglycan editing factor PgeF [Halobacillus litoralis]|uniref:peptidoglycan editing factor PgeF n=1 Tax=Halobacillus litoralis TaxID=45668 RepID=UPI0024932D6B|nr:peptidoglycan editing factor PgeF [Halobacillus litoralis]
MEPFKQKSNRRLTCYDRSSRVLAGLTTRNGGHSPKPYETLNMGLHVDDEKENVLENRRTLAKELGVSLDQWVIGEQVHGTEVKAVGHTYAGAGTDSLSTAVQGVDGLITNEPGLLLAAFYADCVPLFFYDSKAEWVGVAHAGWKGTVNGMAGEMIEALAEQGCLRENIHIVIGPSIGMKHYEVDQKVIDKVPDVHRDKCITQNTNGKYQLDLKALHRQMMIEKKIPAENIQVSGFCTYEENDLFYSHRRDQGKTGRMLGFIGLRT